MYLATSTTRWSVRGENSQPGLQLSGVSDVAVDAADRVYVYQRGDAPIVIFDVRGAEVLLRVPVIRLARTWHQLPYAALRGIRDEIDQSIRASSTLHPARHDLPMVTNADRSSMGRVAHLSFLRTSGCRRLGSLSSTFSVR